jgi:hypothetical protein
MGLLTLIVYHKQATSARLRFVRFPQSVVAASMEVEGDPAIVSPHPGPLVTQAAGRLGLPVGELRVDPEFRSRMLVPEGSATVWLGELTATDPPFEAVDKAGGRFALLTELAGIPDTERDVMRDVYEHILG